MKMNILVICLLFFLTSCQSLLKVSEESSYQEIFLFGKDIREAYDLKLVGFGGGFDKGREIFNFTFMGNQNPNLDEARAIFYDIATKFLERINSNEKLKELTIDNSFSIANLHINIMFPDGENYITGVGNGFAFDRNPLEFVYFFTYTNESKESTITYKEPYEQVKSIVEQQRNLQSSSIQLP